MIARALPSIAMSIGASACTLSLPIESLSGGLPKPISHYAFEETSGELAADDIGGKSATVDGDQTPPAWIVQGKRGRAIDFTTDGYVHIAGRSGTSFPTRASVALWIKLHALPVPNSEDELPELFGAYTDDDQAPIVVRMTTKGTLSLEATTTASQASTTVESDALALERWTLVVFGWDDRAREALLALRPESGKPVVRRVPLPPGFSFAGPHMYFGPRGAAVDELRVWDRALTNEEIDMLVD